MGFKSAISGMLINRLKKIFDAVIGNNDAEQLVIRFMIACSVIVYTNYGEQIHDIQILSWSFSLAQVLSYGYLLTLLITSFSVFFLTLSHPVMRISMMSIDLVFLSVAIGVVPESAAPLFFIYLWVVFGFGFRFGNKYLLTGTIFSLIGFSSAFYMNDYWQTQSSFGIGVMFSLMLLPAYVFFFIRRLNIAKRKLEIAVVKADAANKAKTNFLANMSHELRTPLNGVITVGELLAETKLSGTQEEYMDTIQSSARNLLELVNNVLDFSKIESEKIILDNVCFDLYACLDAVIKIIRPLADQKKLPIYNNISNRTPKYIYGDPIRLKQILINLANNAVKFTEQGHISLNTYSTNVTNENTLFCFEIIDTGIGISQDAQSRIFERFVQEDESTTRRFGGTGLGTSIAKQLVTLMGGVIGVSSNPGKGSRFWFEIEIPVASAEDFESLDADILIISNNMACVKNWKMLLNSWNRKCVVRNDMDMALKILQTWRYSKTNCVILLDEDALQMPAVRAALLIKEVGIKNPILILSTIDPGQKNASGIEASFDTVLDLPADCRQLYNAVMDVPEYEQQDCIASLSAYPDHGIDKKIMPLNILVAEDQTTNQFVFKKILENQGHHILIVDDGQQALDILSIKKFDLAIVDLNMPHVSGIEVIKMFKFMEPGNEMPFVVVTADSSQETLRECREFADAALIKPIEKQQLLDAIYKFASSKSSIPNRDSSPESRFGELTLFDSVSLDEVLGYECDSQFLTELFTVFGRDAKRLINEINQSTRDIKNFPQAKNHAHALRGIANNVSAKQLAAIAMFCEDEIQTNPNITRRADQLIEVLNSCFLATKEAMQNHLSFKRSQRFNS